MHTHSPYTHMPASHLQPVESVNGNSNDVEEKHDTLKEM